MGTNVAARTSVDESAGAPASLGAFTADTGAAALLAGFPVSIGVPAFKRRDVGAVLALSALLHVGLATAVFRSDHTPRGSKRLSRVEVELTRPPPKPVSRPVVPPPPPPKPAKSELKALPTAALVEPAPPSPEAPHDTGSSAPAEEGGELHAGAGGLGTAAPLPMPAPRAPAPPAPKLEAREGANYLKNPRPTYPRRAKREGWEGTTVLRVAVQPSGKPGQIKIHRSSGHDVLDEAAAETVAQWTFVPATQDGKPMEGSVTVPIVFRLQ